MALESKLQTTIAQWLRKKGCFVMVIQPQAGIPTGTPDIVALIDGGGWVAIEVKQDEKSKFQPLQLEIINKLDNMYWSRAVHNNNWPEVKAELEELI